MRNVEPLWKHIAWDHAQTVLPEVRFDKFQAFVRDNVALEPGADLGIWDGNNCCLVDALVAEQCSLDLAQFDAVATAFDRVIAPPHEEIVATLVAPDDAPCAVGVFTGSERRENA